jgi:hypothetical protein
MAIMIMIMMLIVLLIELRENDYTNHTFSLTYDWKETYHIWQYSVLHDNALAKATVFVHGGGGGGSFGWNEFSTNSTFDRERERIRKSRRLIQQCLGRYSE